MKQAAKLGKNMSTEKEVYLAIQKQVLFHRAKLTSDRQQLRLLMISWQIGEEDHMTPPSFLLHWVFLTLTFL